MDVITSRMLREATPLFRVFAIVMILLALGALLSLAQEVLLPFALAFLLSFALSPVATGLQRAGVGRGLSVAAAVCIALVLIGAIGYVVLTQVTELAGDLPKYQTTLHEKVQKLEKSISGGGPFSRAGAVVGEVLGDLQKFGNSGRQQPAPVVVMNRPGDELAVAGEYIAPLARPLGTFAAVLLFTAFMVAQREDIRNRLIRLMGTGDLQQTTAALDDAGRRLARMLLAQLAMNSGFAALAGTGLALIGLPSPYLWGVIAGILRFVPYIGSFIGAILPLLLAFIVDPTWTSVLWTAGMFLVLEPLFGQVVEPLLFGRTSGLSPVAVLVSATVWAFLWGPIGLVLSTPLTIVLVVLGRHISQLEFLEVLLGDKPALAPHEVFYQRMLAGDPLEARLQAREFLKLRALATYYDVVALPALRLAHLDIIRGLLADDRVATLVATTRTLVEKIGADIGEVGPALRRPLGARLPEEDLRPDRPAALLALSPDVLAPEWRGPHAVAILYGDNALDGPPALMLRQAIRRLGLQARVARLADAGRAGPGEAEEATLVCLTFFEPLSAQHLRAASRAVRRRIRGARIMVCIWQDAEPDQTMLAELRRRVRVDAIVATFSDAIEAADAMLGKSRVEPANYLIDKESPASSDVGMRSDVFEKAKAPTSGTRRSTH